MPDIKLKDLRYLVALADTRHFGQAAERCFVSQPTLSAQLKKLEDALEVQLVERRPRQVALTQAGTEIVARARRMLEAREEILALARTHRDPLAGQLRVALLPTIGPYLLPRIVAALRKALPRLTLLLYEYQTAPMLEQLACGQIDLGILALPVELNGLEARTLYEEPFLVALPTQHRLAKQASVQIEELRNETLLLLTEGHCLRDQALAVCNRAGIEERQDFRATSLETLRQMVAAGVGVTLLPELASQGAYGAVRGVVVRPLARPVPTRRIGAVWRKTTARRQAIEAICNVLAARAK